MGKKIDKDYIYCYCSIENIFRNVDLMCILLLIFVFMIDFILNKNLKLFFLLLLIFVTIIGISVLIYKRRINSLYINLDNDEMEFQSKKDSKIKFNVDDIEVVLHAGDNLKIVTKKDFYLLCKGNSNYRQVRKYFKQKGLLKI